MSFTMRTYNEETDKQAMLTLRRSCTTPENVTDYPSLTDLYELLHPLRAEQHTRIRLWEDKAGQLIAYANVSLPFCNLSFFLEPAYWQTRLPEEIIAYGCEAVRRFSQEQGEKRTVDIHCRDTDEQRLQYLLSAGFVLQPDETPVLVRSLREPFGEVRLPEGFLLRHVEGPQEVEQCVELHRAAFGTKNMTVEQRLSIMQEPDYDPQGDLVITAPDGTLVAYAVCAVHPEENAQSGRKWGYTDPIGVHPSFQRQGLGKAVLLGGLHYLQKRGMDTASFMTSSENRAMLGLGAAVDFKKLYSYAWLAKHCAS